MLEVVTVVFLALGCAGVFGVGRLCSRMLAALERLEVSIRALVPAAEAPGGGQHPRLRHTRNGEKAG